MTTSAPFGTWESPISAELMAGKSKRLGEPSYFDGCIYWLETRPEEKGRQVIVRSKEPGFQEDVLPRPWSARSQVHEYGGGNYLVSNESLYFVNANDQQIYSIPVDGGSPKALTFSANCRFADLNLHPTLPVLVAICEIHHSEDNEPENAIVAINLDAAKDENCSDFETLIRGRDFFSNPRFSPDGHHLVYLCWDHPNMPWDNSELWLAKVDGQGRCNNEKKICGNGNESVFQPQWSPSNDLYWISDRSNWWNLFELKYQDISSGGFTKPVSICPKLAEFATPQWVFGMSTYCFLDADTILATATENSRWNLFKLSRSAVDSDSEPWSLEQIESDLSYFSSLNGRTDHAVFIGASSLLPSAIYSLKNRAIAQVTVSDLEIEEKDVSIAREMTFPTKDSQFRSHLFYYPPTNSKFQANPNDLPPLIVIGHGGPTGSSEAYFNLKVQFWTQRGFAVADVNYRGSTGYGRAFRHSLQKQWGIADVEDLATAAEYLTENGLAHANQRFIRGSSAGGFSVLAALTDTDTFNAGCSLYGVGDLESLATDTHKFEARYLDGLVGPYPEEKETYIQRSPIYKANRISCPVLVFQGKLDKVVPPEQAETMVKAIKSQGLPVAYVLYEEEAHGFRQAQNIKHQAEAELYFYQQILGIAEAVDSIPPIKIENWTKNDSENKP